MAIEIYRRRFKWLYFHFVVIPFFFWLRKTGISLQYYLLVITHTYCEISVLPLFSSFRNQVFFSLLFFLHLYFVNLQSIRKVMRVRMKLLVLMLEVWFVSLTIGSKNIRLLYIRKYVHLICAHYITKGSFCFKIYVNSVARIIFS